MPVVICKLFPILLHPTFGPSSVNGQTLPPIVRYGSTDEGSAPVGITLIHKHQHPCIMVPVRIWQAVMLDFHRSIWRFWGSEFYFILLFFNSFFSFIFFLNVSFRYWEVQVDIGESIQGWVFWTWKVSLSHLIGSWALERSISPQKMQRGFWQRFIYLYISSDAWFFLIDKKTYFQAENADEWSYQMGLEGGWIPTDPTNRLYPGICS